MAAGNVPHHKAVRAWRQHGRAHKTFADFGPRRRDAVHFECVQLQRVWQFLEHGGDVFADRGNERPLDADVRARRMRIAFVGMHALAIQKQRGARIHFFRTLLEQPGYFYGRDARNASAAVSNRN